MKKFFFYIIMASLFALPGELLNQVIANHSWPSFFSTMVMYWVLFLPAFYFFGVLIKKIAKNDFSYSLLCYIFFGLAGLAIEWFMIGNAPWLRPEASQVGMFTYWTTLFLGPLIIKNEKTPKKFKKDYILFYIIFSLAFLLPPIVSPSPTALFLSVIILSYGLWLFNLFYLKYFILLARQRK